MYNIHLIVYEDELDEIGQAIRNALLDFDGHHADYELLAEDVLSILEEYGG